MKKLNFGCGRDIRKGWDNVDIQKSKKLTKSFDANKFPYPLEDNTYDYVFLSGVIELLYEPDKCLYELWKKCKPNAIIEIVSAYYNNKGLCNDIQTKHFFTESTFKHFANENSTIDKQQKFEIESISLPPTLLGKFIPTAWLRKKLSAFCGGIISQIHVRLKVCKANKK